jgi:hypothetical protein
MEQLIYNRNERPPKERFSEMEPFIMRRNEA